MKTPSKRDLALILITLFLGIIVGWSASCIWNSRKEIVNVENPLNEGLKKRSDSLEALIHFRDSLDVVLAKKQTISDSIVNKNHTILSKHYENLKNLDIDSRLRAYDSILANYNKVWK